MNDLVIAWHFTGKTLRDGRPIPKIGQWLTHNGPVELCSSGLHASREPFDALAYAPGNILHLVECADVIEEQNDKLVCRKRRIVASMDANEMLRHFARMQALSVVHLWEPADVVLDYLVTGDNDIRDAARDAAWAAAWDAAGATARAAAGATARAAAWDVAWDAAWDAAGAAAWDAAREEFNSLVYECFEGPLQAAVVKPSLR